MMPADQLYADYTAEMERLPPSCRCSFTEYLCERLDAEQYIPGDFAPPELPEREIDQAFPGKEDDPMCDDCIPW